MDKKKKLIILIAGIIVIVAVIVGIVLFLNRDKSYRIIKVHEFSGKVDVERENTGIIEAYTNMVLQSGDAVSTNDGNVTLKLDDDKYIYAEPQTKLRLEATGTSVDSKTKIVLEEGAIINDIQNNLSKDSVYEVNTPNSTMSVRGTVFYVEVYYENDIQYTKLCVFEGEVASCLVHSDGKTSDEVLVTQGKQVIIYDDSKTTDYLGEITDIDYSLLPDNVLENLIDIVENGTVLDVTIEELRSFLDDENSAGNNSDDKTEYTVTFMYGENIFGVQTVSSGETVSEPTLMPASEGEWDFDFTTPITEDTTIEWK
ncbi:MAG: FecR domain-containing protein [Lachnospiraceae bacterium]|nr:FecR domain-containing protein [Lachnospiraceae bacterium]